MKPAVANPNYRVLCVRIVPVVGSVVRFVDYPTNLVIGGQIYYSSAGYEFTTISQNTGFGASLFEIGGIIGYAGISRATVANGTFDGARFYGFATTWKTPVLDEEPLISGIFGQTVIKDDRFYIDAVSLGDVLNQSAGRFYGASCDKKFCGTEFAGCGMSLAANTVTGTITSVTDARTFRDSGRGEGLDIFKAGIITLTSGPNAGLKGQEIRAFAANGTFELFEPFYYLPTVGTTYSAVRGCQKRSVDCKSRWNGSAYVSNILNFGGFEFIPPPSIYNAFGDAG